MNTQCRDLDEALRNGTYTENAEQARHVENCPACRERVRVWQDISSAARGMHKTWESPNLWHRIEQSLEAEASGIRQGGNTRTFVWAWAASKHWPAAAACALLLVLSVALGLVLLRSDHPRQNVAGRPDPEFEKRILTEQALREVEAAEANYIQSIDRLSKLADPVLQQKMSPILLNYRERLLLLDEAIADCRASIELNRSNAYLRRELVSIYQEKQHTLEDLIKEKMNDQQ